MYAKIIDQYTIIPAPRCYENITNFSSSPELMAQHGFVPVTTLYNTETGATCYYEEGQEPTDMSNLTTLPYPGTPYVWDGEAWSIPLSVQKEQKSEAIRAQADAIANAYRQGYSESEQDTWSRQEKGAKDLTDDPDSATDEAEWVRLLATTRGLTVEQQVAKITAAVRVANHTAALILGTQQRLEDEIRNATTQDELDNIVWPDTLL